MIDDSTNCICLVACHTGVAWLPFDGCLGNALGTLDGCHGKALGTLGHLGCFAIAAARCVALVWIAPFSHLVWFV